MDNDQPQLVVELVTPDIVIDEDLDSFEIPLAANAWISNGVDEVITEKGLGNWTSPNSVIHVYFRVNETIKIDLGLKCKVTEGTSTINVQIGKIAKTIEILGDEYHIVPLGTYRIFGSGYLKVDLQGMSKTGDYFADVSHLVIPKNSLPENPVTFVEVENKDVHRYRGGPKVHLKYQINRKGYIIHYYYNEVKVPVGYDVSGSYFKVIGFTHGHFGIQVNSSQERTVLFSVSSPQNTDNPEEPLEENEVLLVSKGEEVITNVSGNEGSQAKLHYNWSADVVYKFLISGRPDRLVGNRTLYSAWFGEKGDRNWRFIARFSRPKTSESLKGFYSSIENFFEDESHRCRKALYNNQWVGSQHGSWFEITNAEVTCDSSAESSMRTDFEGGVECIESECDAFYLKHCGFFVANPNKSNTYSRPLDKQPPPWVNRTELEAAAIPRDLVVELIDTDNSHKKDLEMFEISLCANAWVTKEEGAHEVITSNGVGNWISSDSVVHVFFLIQTSTKLDLFMRCKVPDGTSIIDINVNGVEKLLEIEGSEYHITYIGRFRFIGSGYVTVNMKGEEKTGCFFADVSHVLIPKEECDKGVSCISNFSEQETHWGRRGPFVTLSYHVPFVTPADTDYYYGELFVPKGNDIIGSFFGVVAFDNGYFGIQVNSKTERRVLFSIWSPQETDNPEELLDENRIILVNKGDEVIINTFGDDGCGGESILKYFWSTGITYKFLVHGRPDSDRPNHTSYTAKFGVKGEDAWQLIAEFSRPKCSKYLSGLYSFAQNFIPDYGSTARKAIFGNQWVRKVDGSTSEVTGATVLIDRTDRRDFDVGLESYAGAEGIYLVYCGFFTGKTNPNSFVERSKSSIPPRDLTDFTQY